MREIAHNWISSVRIKVNASRIAAATASAAQSEDRSANQKTTFFDSIKLPSSRTLSRTSAKGVRREKGGAFQWVQVPPGDRSSRKQPEQAWRRRNV
jgi:hypothetical protein